MAKIMNVIQIFKKQLMKHSKKIILAGLFFLIKPPALQVVMF